MKLGLYARVSTHEQQTLTLQRDAMAAYAQQRQGISVLTVEEVGSGVSERRQRDVLMRAARRRDIDAIVVWRLDRWGRSLADLVGTLHELQGLGVGFISLHEALDFTTPRDGRWPGCWRCLPSSSATFYANESKLALCRPGDVAHGMGGRRPSRITPTSCGSSRP
jgi:hypothetical protein